MKDFPFYGFIKNGIFQWKSSETFAGYCKLQKDGEYTMKMSKTKLTEKTREQLGYFHGIIVPTVFRQIIDFAGEGKTVDGKKRFPTIGFMVKDKFKEIPMTEDVVVNLLKQVWATAKGCEVKSKADMTLEECSELIDISIQWAERYLGCQIPPPEKTLI